MGDHIALLVNRLLTVSTIHAAIASRNQVEEGKDVEILMPDEDGDLSSPRKLVECRICQDEDFGSNLEIPCACCGSLKYAHCEICHQPFRPGYSAPPPLFRYGRLPMSFRRNWQISRREQLMQATSTDHHAPSPEVVEPCSRSIICRCTVAMILIGLLILRHCLPIMVGGAHVFVPSLFHLATLRIAGILLLVYVTIMAVSGLRRQRNQDVSKNIHS